MRQVCTKSSGLEIRVDSFAKLSSPLDDSSPAARLPLSRRNDRRPQQVGGSAIIRRARAARAAAVGASAVQTERRATTATAALTAALLLAACAASPYAGIPLAPGAADPALQDEVRRAMAGDKHAQLALGIRFEEGNGVPTDYRKAKRLYELAASDSGGTTWVYSPPVSKNDTGRTLAVDRGPKIKGLEEAKLRLVGLRARVITREGFH
jgi:hypothetical protein